MTKKSEKFRKECMATKSSRNNGKFRQDDILRQFARDARQTPSTESAVALAMSNSKRLKKEVKEEVRMSFKFLTTSK